MEEKVVNNGLADQLKGQQVANEVEHVSEKALIEIVGDLSLEDKEFCEKETKQILERLIVGSSNGNRFVWCGTSR